MGNSKSGYKRAVLLCAFLLLGCSEQNTVVQSDGVKSVAVQTSAAKHSEPKSDSSTAYKNNAPLITLQELLANADVKIGLAEAAANSDAESLTLWQELLLSAADEVDLAANERVLISGKQGLKYLEFQGMKTNYQIAFERAFVEFEELQAVYDDYPAFEELHARSRALVQQRDELVARVAAQLQESSYEGDHIAEAKRQWQNFFLTQSAGENN